MSNIRGVAQSSTTAAQMANGEGVRVSIYDKVYHLKSGADRAYMEEVARYVDRRMQVVASQTQTVDSFRVAVLSALHIADELLRLRQAHEELQDSVAARSRRCLALLDGILEPAESPGKD